jgi:hypothetical protein
MVAEFHTENSMEDHVEERVEVRAMKLAEVYYKNKDWKVKNVARLGGEHGGYDLLLEKDSEQRRVEVKGCTSLYGIPDPHHTEFDKDRRLVADELFVAYFLAGGQRKLAIIPRNELDPEYVEPKHGYRIKGSFKNARMMSRFLREIEEKSQVAE